MKNIPLTRGLFATVDDADHEWLSQWKWHAFRGSRNETHYAVRSVREDGRKRTLWMHREIIQTPIDLVTDHINGDGLDNRRANLRAVSHRENLVNCARHRTGSSRHRGVSWHVRNNCWVAQITVDRRNIYIGRFHSEEDARIAYEARRAELRAGEIYRR